jgi:hypothetical protein
VIRDCPKHRPGGAGSFDVLVDFVVSPRRALEPYARAGRLDKDLTLFALVGTGRALAIPAVAGALGLRDESSQTLAVLSRSPAANAQVLPLSWASSWLWSGRASLMRSRGQLVASPSAQ